MSSAATVTIREDSEAEAQAEADSCKKISPASETSRRELSTPCRLRTPSKQAGSSNNEVLDEAKPPSPPLGTPSKFKEELSDIEVKTRPSTPSLREGADIARVIDNQLVGLVLDSDIAGRKEKGKGRAMAEDTPHDNNTSDGPDDDKADQKRCIHPALRPNSYLSEGGEVLTDDGTVPVDAEPYGRGISPLQANDLQEPRSEQGTACGLSRETDRSEDAAENNRSGPHDQEHASHKRVDSTQDQRGVVV